MILFQDAGPRLLQIPAGLDFAHALAEGLLERIPRSAPPEEIARIRILTNSRRAARVIHEALQVRAESGFLPQIDVFGELGVDPSLAIDSPPTADPLTRRLRLTWICKNLLDRANGALGPVAAAPSLADLISASVDELQEHGLDIDGLEHSVSAEHAAHWEISRLVLQTAQQNWREWAETRLDGALDPADRQSRAIDALIDSWSAKPPQDPVIAAGSTASRPGASRLMAAVSNLPQGAVVLPGADTGLDASILGNMTPEHPQASMVEFMRSAGASWRALRPWASNARPTPELGARARLIAEALRPAPVTDAWRANSETISEIAPDATARLTLIEAPDERREAEAASLSIIEALADPAKTVALVTPDRTLARRVASELLRSGVEADDSGGRPLALTPPGALLSLLADWIAAGAADSQAPVRLLSILKHPMVAAGKQRGAHLDAVRRLERVALRRPTPITELCELRRTVADWRDRGDDRAAAAGQVLTLMDAVDSALEPVSTLKEPISLSALATAHRTTAEALSRLGGDGEAVAPIWADQDGAAALALLTALEEVGAAYGAASATDYAQIFKAALHAEAARDPARPHPRLAIYGPLEARLQRPDRMILAGLDEGVWPETPDPDPWFSRPMRRMAGIPDLERRLGLSAHDFCQGLGAPDVVLTRAVKRGGAATVPSRWLQRLTNLLQGAAPDALGEMRSRGGRLLRIAEIYTRPAGSAPPAPRPRPSPPAKARPRALSVTQVETLIRDPYAIYAAKVLGLRALDPIGGAPDVRERGSAIHRALELFIRKTLGGLPLDPAPDWRNAIEEALSETDHRPAQQALWRRRLERVAPWFLATEAERRELGHPLAVEATGRLSFAAPGGKFTLTAKADRLDLISGEGIAVYDYKTGAPPSAKQVALFAKQLPLEAAIAETGGFPGIPPIPSARLTYFRIGGAGEERRVDSQNAPATQQAQESLDQLKALITAYDDPLTAYTSRARPERIVYDSDYDHLARVDEWSVGEGEEGGE